MSTNMSPPKLATSLFVMTNQHFALAPAKDPKPGIHTCIDLNREFTPMDANKQNRTESKLH